MSFFSKNKEGSIIKNEQMESHSKIAILHFMNERINQTKNYQKKTLFWDRQHLYSQNLMLRQKINELAESNTKAKTKLLKSQKQIFVLTTKERSLSQTSTVFKTHSYNNRFTSIDKIPSVAWRNSKLKSQDKNKVFLQMKQMIGHLKQQIQKLQNQKNFIRKSMKSTRIAELQTQIREMQEENIRLYRLAVEVKQNQQQFYVLYCRQIDEMKTSIRKEGQQKIFYAKQLTKTKNQLKQLLNKYKQLEKVKISNEKRHMNEIQKLKRKSNNLQYTQKNIWNKNRNHSQIQTKLQYSATAFDRSDSRSINFDKLAQIYSNQKFYNYLSEGINLKNSNIQSPSSKNQLQQKEPLISLQLLTEKRYKQQLNHISKSQPFDQQINQQNYEDQFQKQQQGIIKGQIGRQKDIISEQSLNNRNDLQKISIEEELKQNLNAENQSQGYQYILEEDL